jgi:hypothetical protein
MLINREVSDKESEVQSVNLSLQRLFMYVITPIILLLNASPQKRYGPAYLFFIYINIVMF